MDWKKLWPTLIPILALVISSFSGVITAYLATHPTTALVAATVVTALANIVKSPTQG